MNQIKLAQTLIRLMSKDNAVSDTGNADGDDDDDLADISQAENLLESYFAMVQSCSVSAARPCGVCAPLSLNVKGSENGLCAEAARIA